MIRSNFQYLALTTVFAFSVRAPLFGQSPANQQKPTAGRSGTTGEQRREIFCSDMKTGQLCPDDTAEILGLTGPQAEAWKVILRKYNKSADDAALQLQKDSSAKLTPEQMEVLKAWFAVGWNAEINKLLNTRSLDDLHKADTQGLKTTKEEEEEHEH